MSEWLNDCDSHITAIKKLKPRLAELSNYKLDTSTVDSAAQDGMTLQQAIDWVDGRSKHLKSWVGLKEDSEALHKLNIASTIANSISAQIPEIGEQFEVERHD